MLRVLTLALILFVGLNGSVLAQTIEETVLFLMLGADNATRDESGRPIVHQINRNTWRMADHRPEAPLTFQIVPAGQCVYQVTGGKMVMEMNFNNVSEHSASTMPNGRTMIRISGREVIRFIVQGQAGQAEDIYQTDSHASAVRYQRAVEYFRSKFCKGRAF